MLVNGWSTLSTVDQLSVGGALSNLFFRRRRGGGEGFFLKSWGGCPCGQGSTGLRGADPPVVDVPVIL